MKPQAKCALIGVAITIGLLAALIGLDKSSDGSTMSIWVIVGLTILSSLYSFVMGVNAAPITPRTKVDITNQFDTKKIDQEIADNTVREIQRAIERGKK